MPQLRNYNCRFLQRCVTCMMANCTWVGEGQLYPCRIDEGDIDPEEDIVLPLPQEIGDCKSDIPIEVLSSQKDMEIREVLLIFLVAILALLALGCAFQRLRRKRRLQRSTQFQELQEFEFVEYQRT